MRLAQDPNGLGRRRPRMQAAAKSDNPHVRPWNKPDMPDLPTPPKTVGAHPRGPGTCPHCGQEVLRLAVHMRRCAGRLP